MCQHKCGNYWAVGNVEKWASCVIVVYLLLLDLVPEPPITTGKGFPHITPPFVCPRFFLHFELLCILEELNWVLGSH